MSPDVARLIAGAPTPDEVVELLLDAFTGCDPEMFGVVEAPGAEAPTAGVA